MPWGQAQQGVGEDSEAIWALAPHSLRAYVAHGFSLLALKPVPCVQVQQGVGEDGQAHRALDRLRQRVPHHGRQLHGERVVGLPPAVGQGPRVPRLQGALESWVR